MDNMDGVDEIDINPALSNSSILSIDPCPLSLLKNRQVHKLMFYRLFYPYHQVRT